VAAEYTKHIFSLLIQQSVEFIIAIYRADDILDLITKFASYRDLEQFNSILRHDPYGSR